MRRLACAAGLALGGFGVAACGSVGPREPDGGRGGDDGKNGVIIDSAVDGPFDGGMQMLCSAPSNPPTRQYHVNLFKNAEGRTGPDTSCAQVGTSLASTNPQYVFCRRWGGEVRDNNGNYNHWWLWTDLDQPPLTPAWISAYYIQGEGNDVANDSDTGTPIPGCP